MWQFHPTANLVMMAQVLWKFTALPYRNLWLLCLLPQKNDENQLLFPSWAPDFLLAKSNIIDKPVDMFGCDSSGLMQTLLRLLLLYCCMQCWLFFTDFYAYLCPFQPCQIFNQHCILILSLIILKSGAPLTIFAKTAFYCVLLHFMHYTCKYPPITSFVLN